MKELFDSIQVKMVELTHDMDLNVRNGNKAAGVRARKASLDLEKLLKQYRKESLESTKK